MPTRTGDSKMKTLTQLHLARLQREMRNAAIFAGVVGGISIIAIVHATFAIWGV